MKDQESKEKKTNSTIVWSNSYAKSRRFVRIVQGIIGIFFALGCVVGYFIQNISNLYAQGSILDIGGYVLATYYLITVYGINAENFKRPGVISAAAFLLVLAGSIPTLLYGFGFVVSTLIFGSQQGAVQGNMIAVFLIILVTSMLLFFIKKFAPTLELFIDGEEM